MTITASREVTQVNRFNISLLISKNKCTDNFPILKPLAHGDRSSGRLTREYSNGFQFNVILAANSQFVWTCWVQHFQL